MDISFPIRDQTHPHPRIAVHTQNPTTGMSESSQHFNFKQNDSLYCLISELKKMKHQYVALKAVSVKLQLCVPKQLTQEP